MAFKWLDLFFFKWWDLLFFKFFNIDIHIHVFGTCHEDKAVGKSQQSDHIYISGTGDKPLENSEQSEHLLLHASHDFALGDSSMDPKDREINWLDIPDHLLALITENFIENKDYILFGAVCRSWRAIYVENLDLRPLCQLPLLMLPSEDNPSNNQTRTLYSLSEKRLYNTQLSVPHNLSCRGSCWGWLITVHENLTDVCLFNPLSSVDNVIQLPPLTAFPHQNLEIYNVGFLVKAVLSANPAKDPNYVIMAIFGECNRLAFLKPGDKIWTSLDHAYTVMEDVIYYKDQFYAVNFFGAVFACDVNHSHPKLVEIAPPPDDDFMTIKKYLVVSSGDLFQIKRRYKHEDDYSYGTLGFEVFKWDSVTRTWTLVKSLPGQTLFLGDNSSMLLSSSDFPGCKGNCIYFTDDFIEIYGDGEIGSCDMGIFNFEDGSFEPHYPMKGKTIFPPPIWIEPLLK